MFYPPDNRHYIFAAIAAVLLFLAAFALSPAVYGQSTPYNADFDYPEITHFDPKLNCPTIAEIIAQFGKRPLFGMQTVENYFMGLCEATAPPPIRFSSTILGFEAVLPPIHLTPGVYIVELETTSSHIMFQDFLANPPLCWRPPLFGFDPPMRMFVTGDCTIYLTLTNNPPTLGHHWNLSVTKEGDLD